MSLPSPFAFISDIHANIDALETVLADIKEQGISTIICLGDMIGYGPEPQKCLQLVKQNCQAVIQGNHEVMGLQMERAVIDELPPEIAEPLILARRQLTAAEQNWAKTLPLTLDLEVAEAVHSSLQDGPQYFNYISSLEEAAAQFARQKRSISFHGHTHIPVVWVEEKGRIRLLAPKTTPMPLLAGARYAINVGSVGQPRDGTREACYAIFDSVKRTVRFRFLEYNMVACRWRFEKTSIPKCNFQRLLGE